MSFLWNVPATLAANTYAIQIEDSSNVPNYSTEFQVCLFTHYHPCAISRLVC